MNDLPPERLRNRTHAELRVGDSAELTRQLGEADIALFATVSGDMNPAHMDPAFANSGRFGRVIGHGMWTASLISAVLGTRLPGRARSTCARTCASSPRWRPATP